MNHAIIAVMYGYPRILGIIPLILRNTLIYLFFVVGFLGFANNVNAATYYVDQNNVGCGDSNNGSEISPWCTITKAATTMIAGDTAIIKAGTYRESINPSNSGTDGSPITFQAADGETVIASGGKLKTGFTITPGKTYTYQVAETAANLNGYVWEDDTYTKYTSKTSIDQVEASVSSYYHDTVNQILYIHTSDGVDPSTHVIEAYAKSNISGSAKDYITFRGLTFKNAIYGIYHSGSHITVDSSVFYNIGYGIRIRETGSGEYATISDSIIHHNTSYGIQVEKSFATIDGNTVYSNNGKGIVVVATSTTISDNTIYSNTSQGI